MEGKLTIKQEKFAQGLFAGLSQREAYKRAFNAEKMLDKTIDEKACILANSDKVRARIKELQNEFKEKNMLTVEWVLNNLREVTERCLQQEPVKDRDGNLTGEYVFQHAGANKALELIGKHLGMFTDKVEAINHNLNQDVSNLSDEELDRELERLRK